MKKAFHLFSFLFVFAMSIQAEAQNHFPTEIGKSAGEKFTITADTKEIITKWEKSLLTSSKIKVIFSDLEILREDGYYLLLATSEDRKVKSAIELVLDNGKFYQARTEDGGGVTVTCTGCTVGCTPRKVGTLWECRYPCGSDCVKSETVIE